MVISLVTVVAGYRRTMGSWSSGVRALCSASGFVPLRTICSYTDALSANADNANHSSRSPCAYARDALNCGELTALQASSGGMVNSDAVEAQLEDWRATIERYDSEPSSGEGRKELIERARAAEALRDRSLSVDNMFDYCSAALQLAIVLASASVVLGVGWLAWIASGLGGLGLVFALLGWFAPTLIPI